MVNFKEIYHFSRFQRGSNIFQVGGGGGGATFSRGGGGGPTAYSLPPSPPLDLHLDSNRCPNTTFYTYGFFLLVSYNQLRIVHSSLYNMYLGVSGYSLKKNVFFSLVTLTSLRSTLRSLLGL